MANVKPQVRHPTPDELRNLIPLRNLGDNFIDLLVSRTQVLHLPRGTRIQQQGRKPTDLLFLVTGEVLMHEADGEVHKVEGSTTRAKFPLTAEGVPGVDTICSRKSDLMRIPLEFLRQVQELADTEAAAREEKELAKTDEERLEEQIYQDLEDAFISGKINLPGMPDLALRISRHMDEPTATSGSLARIIQVDLSITARLIQVANSAAFAGRHRTKTCQDAVTRLGYKATRELVTSFVLRGLFRTRSALIKGRMQELWEHSAQVGALCHVLAARCPGFNPAEALLMGLVHDIGIIPLLTNAHRYEGLTEDPALLERFVRHLRGTVSALTLQQWAFADEFVMAAEEAENWMRDKAPEPDYADILLVAQLHAYLGSPRMQELPRIDEIPAFRKLPLGELSPKMSLMIVEEAAQEIKKIKRLIA